MTTACTWFSVMVMQAGWFSTTYTTSGLSKIIGAFLRYGPAAVKDRNNHEDPERLVDSTSSASLPLSSSWTRSVGGDGRLDVFPVDARTLKA